jgi:predicted dehydrogenase
LDIVHWYLGVKGPTTIYSTGGRRFLNDNCDVPDVQDAMLEYPGWSMVISIRECCQGRGYHPLGFFGTAGSLHIHRGGYRVGPDTEIHPYNRLPLGAECPAGGPARVPDEGPRTFRTKRIVDNSGDGREMLRLHVRNFLDCVKSRRTPISDLESGHRVATALHLANLSLRLRRPLRWDPEWEQIVDDDEAAEMLQLPYRKPWNAELQSLHVA